MLKVPLDCCLISCSKYSLRTHWCGRCTELSQSAIRRRSSWPSNKDLQKICLGARKSFLGQKSFANCLRISYFISYSLSYSVHWLTIELGSEKDKFISPNWRLNDASSTTRALRSTSRPARSVTRSAVRKPKGARNAFKEVVRPLPAIAPEQAPLLKLPLGADVSHLRSQTTNSNSNSCSIDLELHESRFAPLELLAVERSDCKWLSAR